MTNNQKDRIAIMKQDWKGYIRIAQEVGLFINKIFLISRLKTLFPDAYIKSE